MVKVDCFFRRKSISGAFLCEASDTVHSSAAFVCLICPAVTYFTTNMSEKAAVAGMRYITEVCMNSLRFPAQTGQR